MSTLLSLPDWREAVRHDPTALSLYSKMKSFDLAVEQIRTTSTRGYEDIESFFVFYLHSFSEEDQNRLNSPLLDDYLKAFQHFHNRKIVKDSLHDVRETYLDEICRIGCWNVFFDLEENLRTDTQVCETVRQDKFELFKEGIKTIDRPIVFTNVLLTIVMYDRLEYLQCYISEHQLKQIDYINLSEAIKYRSHRIFRWLNETMPKEINFTYPAKNLEMAEMLVHLPNDQKPDEQENYNDALREGRTELIEFFLTRDLETFHIVVDVKILSDMFCPIRSLQKLMDVLKSKQVRLSHNDEELYRGLRKALKNNNIDVPNLAELVQRIDLQPDDTLLLAENEHLELRKIILRVFLLNVVEFSSKCDNIEMMMFAEGLLKSC